MNPTKNQYNGSEVAIIGISCRFPGAKNHREFWNNLRDGVESISFLNDAELELSSIDPVDFKDPNYVKAASMLDDIQLFDATFFGVSPREAEVMDPQHRLFLECAWESLEDAGYNPKTYRGLIGVYAGARTNTYLFNLFSNREMVGSLGSFEVGLGNDLAFLPTRVSYKLDLKGPSYAVHTACSTSLVAVHLACQNLLIGECDLALAGGVAINVPHRTGYLYQRGGIVSSDGHCKTFDAKAQGTIFGSGIGIVVLKRLEDALSDRDAIYAVIKGSATNNDGALKASFTAPSVYQQSEVILAALANAEVKPETISYIEAHGTGTALGDSIEIGALGKAFRTSTSRNNFCAIGSVKSNFGHLDAAAGIAGLIKTILALKHRQVPPSLHFEQPNPHIDFANSPFYVNSRLREWHSDGSKLRAGVSSFGVGGTNAHVVLEEAPETESGSVSREYQLITLSAMSRSAIEVASSNLAKHLQEAGDEELADVVYTLQVGRKRMSHRRIVVCRDKQEAVRLLESKDPRRVLTAYEEAEGRSVVFMFPGGGAQYVNMGLGLYQTEKIFRQEMDRCSEILNPAMGCDLRDYLYPRQASMEDAKRRMKRPSIGLPALFAVEYAMARQLEVWGIKADAMIGHSLGEYVAACLAGVFSLEDALKIVAVRGELFEELPRGGMLSVCAKEEEIRRMIGEELSIAAVNALEQVVVSGGEAAIAGMCERMEQAGIEYQRVQIDVAAHSHLVEGILDRYEEYVRGVEKGRPVRRYISNVSGKWVEAGEAVEPGYWRRQLRGSVRFSEGVKELIAGGAEIMLEVGPGHTLRSLLGMQKKEIPVKWVIGTVRSPQEEGSDKEYLTEAVGKLWMAGVDVDWSKYYEGEERWRVWLPTYPFERRRYWIEARSRSEEREHSKTTGKNEDVSKWFYLPGWQTRELRRRQPLTRLESEKKRKYVVMEGADSLSRRLIEKLETEAAEVIRVRSGEGYRRMSEREYVVRAEARQDYEELFKEAVSSSDEVIEVVHLWTIGEEWKEFEGMRAEERFRYEQQRGFYSLLSMAQAFAKLNVSNPINIDVISSNLHHLSGEEGFSPEKSTLLAFCRVIPQETPNISCRSIDISLPQPESKEELRLIDQLITAIESDSPDMVSAYRANRHWVQIFEPLPLERCAQPIRPLRAKGVYLITGGLGGVGLMLAEYLARTLQAKLVLTGRSLFPERSEWAQWLVSHGENDEISLKIRRLQAMETAGAEIVIASVDIVDEYRMKALVESTLQRFGALHGVLHAAGVTSGSSVFKPFTEIGIAEAESQFQPKGYGLYVLERVLQNIEIDFCLLFSSNASVLGGLGLVSYSAANTFMDAFALSRHIADRAPWISANWDPWPEETKRYTGYHTSIDQYTMTTEESLDAFNRLVTWGPEGQVVISTGDLLGRLDLWINCRKLRGEAQSVDGLSTHPRPDIKSLYVAPRNDLEQTIADIWQQILGLELIGVHDDFLSLGGHSLLATRLVSRLREAFQIELQIGKFFQSPTVAGMAQTISDLRAEQQEREKNELLDILSQLSDDEVKLELERQTKNL
jgi:phthiocerol/phenolphthiocerol synthesis type-I polyketide synthase E